MKNVYEIREIGKAACNTEGSEHYINREVEPIDLTMAIGAAEGFFIGSIIKYVSRYIQTRNLKDIVKCVDFGHLLAGLAISESQEIKGERSNNHGRS